MPTVIAAEAWLLYSKDNETITEATTMKKVTAVLVGLITCTLLVVTQVHAGSSLEVIVLALAENVLGAGQVTSVRTTDNDATVLMRWQSATLKPSNTPDVTRELLYAEAVLTSNSIMGPMNQISRIRFTILHGDQMLATGQATRLYGVSLMFAPALGGGSYHVPAGAPRPTPPGGDGVAQVQ